MADSSLATTLDRIRVYPIKSLDGVDVDAATLADGGGLTADREFALVDADGDYVNGKNERRIHRVRADIDLDARTVSLDAPRDEDGPAAATFHLDDDRAGIEGWLTEFLGYDVSMVGERSGGYPDDTDLTGPTVISLGTLRTVASWYDDISVDAMRRRLRANVELATEEPFAEDRLVAEPGEQVRFRVADTDILGVNPCQRCVVPSRDPDTGAETDGFRARFVEKRRETMPPWSGGGRFDHYFRLMVNTVVPEASVGDTLRVGDAVESVGTESA